MKKIAKIVTLSVLAAALFVGCSNPADPDTTDTSDTTVTNTDNGSTDNKDDANKDNTGADTDKKDDENDKITEIIIKAWDNEKKENVTPFGHYQNLTLMSEVKNLSETERANAKFVFTIKTSTENTKAPNGYGAAVCINDWDTEAGKRQSSTLIADNLVEGAKEFTNEWKISDILKEYNLDTDIAFVICVWELDDVSITGKLVYKKD